MSSIVIPYKVCPLVNSATIVMNYPNSYTVHVERDGTVFVWPQGYGGDCYEYDSVHHHNGWPDKPRRVNSNTHAGYDWSGGGGGGVKMELEEGEIIEEEEEEEQGMPPSLYKKLENEIVEMNYLLQLKQTYLEQEGALDQSEREAVEEEIFSLTILLTRKENFFNAVSQGLTVASLESICAEDKMDCDLDGSRGKKLRDKKRTKAFRRERETAWINKSGFRFQEEEDEAMAYMVKKAKEAESEV